MRAVTDARDLFVAVLLTQPLLPADAIVVLLGEEGEARTRLGLHFLAQGVAPRIVLTGGREDDASCWAAPRARAFLIGDAGLDPDRILTDAEARHTGDQARNVVALAAAEGWKRLIVVASGYHLPRAALTLIRALRRSRLEQAIYIMPQPVPTPWSFAPPDGGATREVRWRTEWGKINRYVVDVASPAQGLEYFTAWERQLYEPARPAADTSASVPSPDVVAGGGVCAPASGAAPDAPGEPAPHAAG